MVKNFIFAGLILEPTDRRNRHGAVAPSSFLHFRGPVIGPPEFFLAPDCWFCAETSLQHDLILRHAGVHNVKPTSWHQVQENVHNKFETLQIKEGFADGRVCIPWAQKLGFRMWKPGFYF